MYSDDDLLPLSGLQHLMFCERQWGLIHIEQIWEENRLTAEGRVLHERTHQPGSDNRPGIRTARGLRLHSLRLGLIGQADVVEFRRAESGVALPETDGFWRPFPVEYKRGRPKKNACDEVQLCAQALCLEEMFTCQISEGSLFYGEPRRRRPVVFSVALRTRTESLAARMHELCLRRGDLALRGLRAQVRGLLADGPVYAAITGQAGRRSALSGTCARERRGLG